MGMEQMASPMEKAMDAGERKEAIVSRASAFRSSEAFAKLDPMKQQKFENYWMLVNGGLSEDNQKFNYDLSDFEQFMSEIGA